MDTYKIIRYYHPSQDMLSETIQEGLTLEEAQTHCSDPTNREEGIYFDGYTKE